MRRLGGLSRSIEPLAASTTRTCSSFTSAPAADLAGRCPTVATYRLLFVRIRCWPVVARRLRHARAVLAVFALDQTKTRQIAQRAEGVRHHAAGRRDRSGAAGCRSRGASSYAPAGPAAAAGQISARPPGETYCRSRPRPTELDRPTQAFNRMLDRLEAASSACRPSPPTSAHDLRTPINNLLSGAGGVVVAAQRRRVPAPGSNRLVESTSACRADRGDVVPARRRRSAGGDRPALVELGAAARVQLRLLRRCSPRRRASRCGLAAGLEPAPAGLGRRRLFARARQPDQHALAQPRGSMVMVSTQRLEADGSKAVRSVQRRPAIAPEHYRAALRAQLPRRLARALVRPQPWLADDRQVHVDCNGGRVGVRSAGERTAFSPVLPGRSEQK